MRNRLAQTIEWEWWILLERTSDVLFLFRSQVDSESFLERQSRSSGCGSANDSFSWHHTCRSETSNSSSADSGAELEPPVCTRIHFHVSFFCHHKTLVDELQRTELPASFNGTILVERIKWINPDLTAPAFIETVLSLEMNFFILPLKNSPSDDEFVGSRMKNRSTSVLFAWICFFQTDFSFFFLPVFRNESTRRTRRDWTTLFRANGTASTRQRPASRRRRCSAPWNPSRWTPSTTRPSTLFKSKSVPSDEFVEFT